MSTLLAALLSSSLLRLPTTAEACEYAPSEVMGKAKTAVTASATGAVAAAGATLKAAGMYAFPHATAGLMLGSTAAGSSAAGTVGIVAGTGGAVGAVGALLISPVVITGAAASAAGIAAFEAICQSIAKPPTGTAP